MGMLAGPAPEMKGSPCAGNRGGECRVNPSAGLWGMVPWGGRREWRCGSACPCLGPSFCAAATARNKLPVPLCLSFPDVRTGRRWSACPAGRWGLEKTLGRAARLKQWRYSLALAQVL